MFQQLIPRLGHLYHQHMVHARGLHEVPVEALNNNNKNNGVRVSPAKLTTLECNPPWKNEEDISGLQLTMWPASFNFRNMSSALRFGGGGVQRLAVNSFCSFEVDLDRFFHDLHAAHDAAFPYVRGFNFEGSYDGKIEE